jgi:hypothetical protein
MTTALNRQHILAAAELARRKCESLRLFRALPSQDKFFRCQARETLVRGGNRSGKSVISAVRFAAMATDQKVTLSDGSRVDARLPWQKGRPLIMWCVGLGQAHIGQTLHRLLFRAGLFRMIRDLETNEWRTFRPWDPEDDARSAEVKPSPPLISSRFISPDSWAWENKSERVFTKVEIINPETKETLAEIYAFTSSGDVKAGDPVDMIWIDEHIKFPRHYPEWQARLIDRIGILNWSSYPNASNTALRDLSRRAQQQSELEKPSVAEFRYRMSDNPFLDEKAKADARAGWSEEEAIARDDGEFATDQLRMYHKFNRRVHSAIIDDPQKEDDVSRAIRDNNLEPPADWTRELILDPGTSWPAVLLCAIPPPWMGRYFVPYKEIYVSRQDADQLAELIYRETAGHWFERFIIDPNAARQTPMGFNHTIERNYSNAFSSKNLQCSQTGTSFTYGSNDVAGRIGVLQSWLTITTSGLPRLRIVAERCPILCQQLADYMKGEDSTGMLRDYVPAKGQKIDLAVCLEYWASREPAWAEPGVSAATMSPMHKLYSDIKKMFSPKGRQERESDGTITLGPPSGVLT